MIKNLVKNYGLLALSFLSLLAGVFAAKMSWLGASRAVSFYYVSGIFFVLSLLADARRLLKKREAKSQKELQRSLNFSGMVLILILINLLAARHEVRIDMTAEKLFSLSDETIRILKSVNEDIRIVAFLRGRAKEERGFESFIQRYQKYTPRLKTEILDPDVDLKEVDRYSITEYKSLVLEREGRWVVVNQWDEENFMAALLKLLQKKDEWLCYGRGHGEPDTQREGTSEFSGMFASLDQLGYKTKEILLPSVSEIDASCEVLMILAPQSALSAGETKLLQGFFNAGKSLLIFLEPGHDGGLRELLESWGLQSPDNFVVDPEFHLALSPVTSPLVGTYGAHPVTQGIQEVSLFPMPRAFVEKPLSEGIRVTPVAFTSVSSWGETDFKKTPPKFDADQDLTGPLSVAFAVERKPEGRAVIVGDSDFVKNENLHFGANQRLLTNAVHWLSNEENLLNMDVHRRRETRINITDKELERLKPLVLYGFPGVCFVVLFGIWYRRGRF